MKIPFSWLKEYVALKASAEEAAKRLTFAGLEVEGIEKTGGGEAVLEVNVTANRGDCLSILGIAREVAAIFGVPLRDPKRAKLTPSDKDPIVAKMVKVAKPGLCPRYQLAVIEGVKIAPSPEWLAQRLEKAGIRPINNVVDVTNYVLVERGQPLHAFDRKKIRGGKIIVRTARDGEKLRTLDGQERVLKTEDLVISDGEGPVALAGVMGSKDSEVDPSTTSIALECAFFEPDGIRRTARRLGIQTESSYRFERRVDPMGLSAALERAVVLILETAGGSLIGPVVDQRKGVAPTQAVSLKPSFVEGYLGGSWPKPFIKQALKKLSFVVKEKGADQWSVAAPSYRGDIQRVQDVVEEVARIGGYERIPVRFPELKSPPPPEPPLARLAQRVSDLLTDLGFTETIHYSFMSPDDLHGVSGLFGPGAGDVSLENPLGREFSLMRPSLVPGLLQSALHHQSHKMETLRLFEMRSGFARQGDRQGETQGSTIVEKRLLAGLLMGPRPASHWSVKAEPSDFYDLKGAVESVLKLVGSPASFETSEIAYLHPRKQAVVRRGDALLALLGEIHPDLQAQLELKRAVNVFEMDWEALAVSAGDRREVFREFGRFPIVERDLALVLDDEVPAGRVADYLKAGDAAVREVSVFDLYRGQPIPSGKKSLAFAVRLAHPDRTMTEGEVNEIYGRLVAGVKQSFNAEIR